MRSACSATIAAQGSCGEMPRGSAHIGTHCCDCWPVLAKMHSAFARIKALHAICLPSGISRMLTAAVTPSPAETWPSPAPLVLGHGRARLPGIWLRDYSAHFVRTLSEPTPVSFCVKRLGNKSFHVSALRDNKILHAQQRSSTTMQSCGIARKAGDKVQESLCCDHPIVLTTLLECLHRRCANVQKPSGTKDCQITGCSYELPPHHSVITARSFKLPTATCDCNDDDAVP